MSVLKLKRAFVLHFAVMIFFHPWVVLNKFRKNIIHTIEDILKVKPTMKIQFRVLRNYEQVSTDDEVNDFCEITQTWHYNNISIKSCNI